MVFQNKEIGGFINSQFIAFRITPSDEVYKQMRKDFSVRGTPTVLLMKPDGEEIDRICGFNGEIDPYFQTIKDYLKGKGTLPTLISQQEDKPEDIDANFKLAKRYVNRWEEEKAVPYFSKVLALDPGDNRGFKTEAGFYVAIEAADSHDDIAPLKAFIAENADEKFLYRAYLKLSNHLLEAKEKEKAVGVYEEALDRLPDNPQLKVDFAMFILTNRIEDRFETAKAIAESFKDHDDNDVAFYGHYGLIRYYRLKKNEGQVLAAYKAAVQRFPETTFFLNGFASTVLRSKIEAEYATAIEMERKATELEPKMAAFWATLGSLYFEAGDRIQAETAMRKAVELDPDSAAYKNKLEKYQKEEL